jgi:hypothetical protein
VSVTKKAGKQFDVPPSQGLVAAGVTKILKDKVADSRLSEIAGKVAGGLGTTIDTTKKEKAKEAINDVIKQCGFKVHGKFLDELYETCLNKKLKFELCNPKDHPGLLETYLKEIPDSRSTIFNRAVGELPMIGFLGLEEGFPPYLMLIAIEIEGMIWVPSAPSEMKLESDNSTLHENEIDPMLVPLYKELVDHNELFRGAVVVIGPKGKEYDCGEVISRVQIPEKYRTPIKLENDYQVNLLP